jgi:hypothetical protein
VAYGINNSGEIVGNADGYGNGGFLYENGKYSPINLTIPGLLINGVTPRGISGNGDIVGYYDWINQKTLTSGTSGFLDVNGVFTTINVPGATSTRLYGINNAGDIVGNYSSPNSPINSSDGLIGFLATPVSSISATPEPPALVLFGSSLLLLGMVALRRRGLSLKKS